MHCNLSTVIAALISGSAVNGFLQVLLDLFGIFSEIGIIFTCVKVMLDLHLCTLLIYVRIY